VVYLFFPSYCERRRDNTLYSIITRKDSKEGTWRKGEEMGLHASGTNDPKEVRNWRIHLLGLPAQVVCSGEGGG